MPQLPRRPIPFFERDRNWPLQGPLFLSSDQSTREGEKMHTIKAALRIRVWVNDRRKGWNPLKGGGPLVAVFAHRPTPCIWFKVWVQSFGLVRSIDHLLWGREWICGLIGEEGCLILVSKARALALAIRSVCVVEDHCESKDLSYSNSFILMSHVVLLQSYSFRMCMILLDFLETPIFKNLYLIIIIILYHYFIKNSRTCNRLHVFK